MLALLVCFPAAGENDMAYDLSSFTNVTVSGIDTADLGEKELSVLFQAARWCQAMTDGDTDTMRSTASSDMLFTHMSGRQQTREEYFSDMENGYLTYRKTGIEDPEIYIDGDLAVITYTAALDRNEHFADY